MPRFALRLGNRVLGTSRTKARSKTLPTSSFCRRKRDIFWLNNITLFSACLSFVPAEVNKTARQGRAMLYDTHVQWHLRRRAASKWRGVVPRSLYLRHASYLHQALCHAWINHAVCGDNISTGETLCHTVPKWHGWPSPPLLRNGDT